jgi:hypothetical protein
MLNLNRTQQVRCCLSGLLFVFVMLTSGCQANTKASVKGKVTYKGQPVTTGSVNFVMAAKGVAAQANLDSTGTFTIPEGLEAGSYKVYLSPPLPEQLPPGKMSNRPAYNIPPKFQDPTQSPLAKDVKAGNNEIPVEIE